MDELRAWNAVSRTLNRSLKPETTVQRALEVLLRARRYRFASILLPDWETQEIEVYIRQRDGGKVSRDFRRFDLLALSASTDLAGTLPLHALFETLAAPASDRSLLAVPLTANRQVLGLLAASVPSDHRPLQRERRLLASIGAEIGVAVTNARLHERVQREADQLAAVNAIGTAVRKSLGLPNLLTEALEQLLAVTNLELAVVFTHGEGSTNLSPAAQSGLSKRLASTLSRRLSKRELLPQPAGEETPTIEEDLPVGQHNRAVPGRKRSPRCLMHIPLRWQGQRFGFLTVGSYSQRHFAPGATDFLLGIASQMSLALANAQLYQEAERRAAELAAANEALREAGRSKDQFLANVTHELKRPLAPARLVLESLLETPREKLSPRRQEQLLRNALSNLDNLNALVSELLDAVRLERQTQPSTHKAFDLRAVARQALATMRPLAEARKIQIHTIFPSQALQMQGDPEALSRVVSNLLSNAIKFNKERGSVLLQLEETPASQAILTVTDTGIGIPQHARAHIFERFYQADGSSTRTHEGLGLGLFIAKGIVEQHGGHIRFDTEEGVGTTFTVTLPLMK